MKKVIPGLILALAVTLCSSAAFAQMSTIFGPQQYTRSTRLPQTFSDTFSHCGTQQCQIVITNGNDDGTNRVSSASIYLNGEKVAGTNAFNQKADAIIEPVTLAAQNEIKTRLASKPGGFLTVEVQCTVSPATLSLEAPGVSLPDSSTLLSAVRIVNTGTTAAENVNATAITVPGGTITAPVLPDNLDTIQSGGYEVLNADFSGGPFSPETSYPLTVAGTYDVGDSTYCFTLTTDLLTLPVSPGSAVLGTVDVGSNFVSGAPFPPYSPSDFDSANDQNRTVPIAPFVPGTPTATGTQVENAPFGDPDNVVFEANNGIGLAGVATGITGPAEPSGAGGGGVIFTTANWTAAYSEDGGSHWTQIDPSTIFPNTGAGGGCQCDQIIQYVPQIDRFVWLIQGNGYRLAEASPADIISSKGTAWTHWDLTPALFGSVGGFDYPDLSVGSNYLYLSWDSGCPRKNSEGKCIDGGFQVARISLTGIQNGGTITIGFTDPKNSPNAWGSHLTQDTGDEIFWAGHDNNSKLTVWSLQEESNTYYWRNTGISSWATTGVSSTTPDGQDWISECKYNKKKQLVAGGFPGSSIIGATRSGSGLWFAWTAGTDSNFPRAHIEMVRLERNDNFEKTQQVQIWNSGYAFAYPALSTNACTGEVGLSFEYGGGGHYENHVVGFWGDYVAYITTGSNVGACRYGDYVTIRQAPLTDSNPGNLFTAFGYGQVKSNGSTSSDVHYVLFGRPASSCVVIR